MQKVTKNDKIHEIEIILQKPWGTTDKFLRLFYKKVINQQNAQLNGQKTCFYKFLVLEIQLGVLLWTFTPWTYDEKLFKTPRDILGNLENCPDIQIWSLFRWSRYPCGCRLLTNFVYRPFVFRCSSRVHRTCRHSR